MTFIRSNGQHGSVTVILTMVLVPMVVIAGIFVDGGRALLAQSVMKSTEQLALNHVLAQNDPDLHKLFGLLAVIDSEKLDAQARDIIQSSLSGSPDESGGDILQIELTAAGSAGTIFAVDNANLARSEVLANQMIEFMKYRAPANFVADLLSSIQWLTTMKTNLEMIRAKIAYLNKVTDVINEGAALIEKVDQIITSFESLIAAADALITLQATDPIATIYADALSQVLIDLDGDSEGALTADEEKVLDERLKKAHDAIANLQDAAKAVQTSVSGFSTLPLRDAIKGLTAEKDAYKSAIDTHKAATSETDEDVAASEGELTTLQTIIDTVEESLESAGDAFVVEVETIAETFVDDALLSAKVTAADFAEWDTYDGVAKFAGGYVNRVVAATKVSAEDAAGQLGGALSSAVDSVFKSLREKLTQAVEDQIQAVLQDLKDALVELTVEIVGEEAKVSITSFFKVLNEQLQVYKNLLDALTDQKASPFLGDGDRSGEGIGTDRPSEGLPPLEIADGPAPGSINNKDQLAGGADGLLNSINVVLDSIKNAVSSVVDSILIAEYVVGQFTYSSLAKTDGNTNRLTDTARCAGAACAAEAEYVLTGDNSPRTTYGMVFLIRLGANLITAFRDPIVVVIRNAVTAIPFVGAALSFVVPVVAAIIQSVDDLAMLANGKEVELYTSELGVLRGDGVVGSIVSEFPELGVEASKPKEPGPSLSYAHYLEMFLVFGLSTGLRSGMVDRAGDIIQFNMGYLDGNDSFRMSQATTAFTVTAEYRVKPLVSSFFTFEDAGGGLFEGANGVHRLTSVGGF